MRLSSSRSTAILHRPQQDFLLWDKAGTRPSLDQQFADRKDLIDAISGQQLITHTRASAGTYRGSDGLIKTATTDEARFDHDPVTGESLGLLVEEQRSNLLLNSGALATQDVTVTAVAHTLSFYGSGTVTLSGTHTATVVGTGAYPARTTLTFTPTAGTLTVTVSGTVEYANLEIGSFATSYIPTAGSTVTRAADVVSIEGANFSSWYRQDEGTVFGDTTSFNSDTSKNTAGWGIDADDTTDQNRIWFYHTKNQYIGSASGSTQYSLNFSDIQAGVRLKSGFSYKENDIAASSNGLTPLVDTSATLPTVDRLFIGKVGIGATELNGTIRRLVYWDQRLPNSTLQTITQ